MKIGILTLPISHNYGCVLQLWALYTYLSKQGHDVYVLNRRWNNIGKVSVIKHMERYLYNNIICRPFVKFTKRMKLTKEVRDSLGLLKQVETLKLDAVIVGSDQIWRIENTRGVDLNFFLDFVDAKPIKKVAYAASFGNEIWKGTKKETERISRFLKNFSGISVREKQGVNMCQDIFGVKAINVVDPTLLLTSKDYNNLLPLKSSESFISTYILDEKENISLFVKEIAAKNNLEIKKLYGGNGKFTQYISITDWLQAIRDAKYVIVDSFHGMIFSIIFHKQFVVFCNQHRGTARFTSLLSLIGLEDRLILDNSDFDINIFNRPINYDDVAPKLCKIKENSISFLKESLL